MKINRNVLAFAANLNADFVTSNGKQIYGFTDGQVILRTTERAQMQGVYIRILGNAGTEKLYAFGYNSNGVHQFISKTALITLGYDARFTTDFSEEISSSGLQFVSMQSLPQSDGTVLPSYITLLGYGVNEKPNFSAFTGGFEKGLYPTNTGFVYESLSVSVSQSYVPKPRVAPQTTSTSTPSFGQSVVSDTQIAKAKTTFWAARKTWEKTLIILLAVFMGVLAVRSARKLKFKIKK
jgi:hypothetical protein